MTGGRITSGVIEQGGANMATWMNNLAIVRATTTNAGDTVRITSADGSALSPSNYGWITLPGTTAGQLSTFSLTADVSIVLTGAHWGIGTTGDITGALLRVLAINDNGTLRWGVAYQGGRRTLNTSNTSATATDINLPEEVLCTTAVGSATNRCREIGYVKADFDDTGGASEDLWAIQTGIDDVVTGESADGILQPWNYSVTGFSANPTSVNSHWTMIGSTVFLIYTATAGTSNATTYTMTAPIKSQVGGGCVVSRVQDNSSYQTGAGMVGFVASSTTIDLYINGLPNVWTASGTKVVWFMVNYQAFQP